MIIILSTFFFDQKPTLKPNPSCRIMVYSVLVAQVSRSVLLTALRTTHQLLLPEEDEIANDDHDLSTKHYISARPMFFDLYRAYLANQAEPKFPVNERVISLCRYVPYRGIWEDFSWADFVRR